MVMAWAPLVIPDFADKVENRWGMGVIGVFNLKHTKTWLTFTGVWLTDFDFSEANKDNLLSTLFVANPNYSKFWTLKSWDKVWLTVDSKINILPKMRDENNKPYMSYAPDIVWSYTTEGGLTVEWMWSHEFAEEDVDRIRLTISQQINKVQLALQAWYDTAYAKTHKSPWYLRLLANLDLWDLDLWFWKYGKDNIWAQASFVFKNGKVIPTGTLIYNF